MNLDVHIGDLRQSVKFAIVSDLAEPLIIGTAYQEKFIEFIQCKTRRLKPIDSGIVAMLDIFKSLVCKLESPDDARPRKLCRYADAQ